MIHIHECYSTLVNNSAGAALFSQLAQGNKTVFLPNNEAVDKVPQETRRNPALLTSILSYHVVDGGSYKFFILDEADSEH